MSLQQWLENSWISQVEPATKAEAAGLLAIADREIADASLDGISPDGRFALAYNAVRALGQLALRAAGFIVTKGMRQHERTIESLKFTLGGGWTDEVDYLDQCRRLRNKSQYDRSGQMQQRDADDLLASAVKLRTSVLKWLEENHPALIGKA